jgi:hypothetical protein
LGPESLHSLRTHDTHSPSPSTHLARKRATQMATGDNIRT